jgi:uncharacterized protein with ATP-grasp and redox domains
MNPIEKNPFNNRKSLTNEIAEKTLQQWQENKIANLSSLKRHLEVIEGISNCEQLRVFLFFPSPIKFLIPF